jgi:hypothetical protein
LLLVWRIAFGQPIAIRQWLRDVGAAGAYLLAPAVVMFLPYQLVQEGGGFRYGYTPDALPNPESFVASPTRLHQYLQREWLGSTAINDAAYAFLFPGVVVLVMALVAIALWRPRSREDWRNDPTGYYAALGALSTLMFLPAPIGIWHLVYWLPGFTFIRVPPRFIIVVVMCLGVLLAAAVDRLTGSLSRWARLAIVSVVALGLLAEYVSYPFPAVPYAVPVPAVDRWLDTQPKPFVVAEVPVPHRRDWGAHERMQVEMMLHATAHWQKTIHGYSSLRRPLHARVYIELADFPDERSITSLRELGVTYVVAHTERYPGDRWNDVESRLAGFPELQLIHTEGTGRVYALRTTPSDASGATRR